MSISLGFGLITCQRYPGDQRSDAQIYAEALDLAEQAETLGLDSVWVSEHHFVDDGYAPSMLPLCAAIAARTRRVQIGTGLLLAPLHDPIRLAEDAAVTDLLSGGRLTLGFGLGWRAEEFAGLGIPLDERVPRLVASLGILRDAWRGDLVSGGAGRPAVPVRPRPARPGGPPLWIGANSKRAIRRAGRLADGFMATEVTPGQLAEQASWAREEFAAAGRTGQFTVSMHLPVFAWHSPDAWPLIRDYHRYIDWKYEDMERGWARAAEPSAPPPLRGEEESVLRESIILGTPEQVAGTIDEYRRNVGGDLVFIARLYFPGLPADIQAEALRIFANEVAPLARDLAGDDGG